ncbi:MAG: ABC transporter substrate-binding protein [Nitrospirota bacterium]|nr:ABC transporter substrate-binding protein [Nitrospirota bacterium]
MRRSYRRSCYLTVLPLCILAWFPMPTEAGKLVIVLLAQQTEPYQNVLEGFRQSLRKQGIEAEYEVLNFDAKKDQRGTSLEAIKTKNPALMFTLGSAATEAAIREIKHIPIIAGMIVDEKALLQAENATGVILDFPLKTQLDWIRRMLPDKKTVGVLFNPNENQHLITQARELTEAMGLTLYARQVESPRDLPDALDSLSRRADVVWGLTDSVALTPETAKGILLFSFRNRIPFVGLSTSWVKAGAVYALDRDYVDIGQQCGELAGKVLRDGKMQGLQPLPPRKVLYALNLKTVNHMKLDLSDEIIKGAQTVFN